MSIIASNEGMDHGVKRSENTKQQHEELKWLSKFFSFSQEMLCVIDTEGYFKAVNPLMTEKLGWSEEELLNTRMMELIHPDEKEKTRILWDRYLAEGTSFNINTYLKCKDNVYRWISWKMVADNDEQLVYSFGLEITGDEEYLNGMLHRCEDNYRKLLAMVSDAVLFFDLRTDKFVDVNEMASSLYGYSREEFMEMKHSDILEDPSIFRESLEQVLAGKTAQVLFHRHRRKDGRVFPVEVSLEKFSIGTCETICEVIRDITDQKRAEEEHHKLEEQFRQAQKLESIGRLAGGLAHDLNNLLTPIMGFTEMALLNLDSQHSLYPDLQQVKASACKAGDLTRQLLAFSRKQVLDISILNLNKVISGFEKMIRRLIGEDIEVITRLNPAIKPIKADQSQLEQILMNLAVNARDAMPNGGELIIQTANCHLVPEQAKSYQQVQPGPYVLLTVTDTGYGMSGDTVEKVFEPFFTTKEPGKGTGLGLSTVYGIIRQHDGCITVESKKNQGTTFKIFFPVVTDKVEVKTSMDSSKNISGNETILLVEDDDVVCKLIKSILTKHGYNVLLADNTSHALFIAQNHDEPIDLLLTDVIMPDMNGKDLYEKILVYRPTMKVLYMSGYTEDIVSSYGVLEPGTKFIWKPFTVQALAGKVRQVFDN